MRYLTIRKIIYSHTIQIHSSNTVIIRFVTAIFTSRQVYFLVTIRRFRMPTNRTARTCQIFHYKESVLWITFNECLRYRMVHILHPTVFSMTNRFEPSSWGWRMSHWKLFTKLGIVRPFLFHSFPAFRRVSGIFNQGNFGLRSGTNSKVENF